MRYCLERTRYYVENYFSKCCGPMGWRSIKCPGPMVCEREKSVSPISFNALINFDPESVTNKDTFERGLIKLSDSDFNTPVELVGKKMEQ